MLRDVAVPGGFFIIGADEAIFARGLLGHFGVVFYLGRRRAYVPGGLDSLPGAVFGSYKLCYCGRAGCVYGRLGPRKRMARWQSRCASTTPVFLCRPRIWNRSL